MISFRMQTEGKMFLENAAAMARAKGLDVDTKLIEGIPYQVLTELSKSHDMIIMGVTGKSGGYGRVGGTADKVIENAYCPVLTLKSGSRKIEEVLLPVANQNDAAIDVAIETVKRIKGRLTVFSVKSNSYDAETLVRTVAEKCAAEGIEVATEIGMGNPVDQIIGELTSGSQTNERHVRPRGHGYRGSSGIQEDPQRQCGREGHAPRGVSRDHRQGKPVIAAYWDEVLISHSLIIEIRPSVLTKTPSLYLNRWKKWSRL